MQGSNQHVFVSLARNMDGVIEAERIGIILVEWLMSRLKGSSIKLANSSARMTDAKQFLDDDVGDGGDR